VVGLFGVLFWFGLGVYRDFLTSPTQALSSTRLMRELGQAPAHCA